MQYFPFPAYCEKGRAELTPKVIETQGCMALGHSNWNF